MNKLSNPFVIQGYLGRKYFCDRESELQLLKEHVLNDRNFTIYGWRRLGKTSLLMYLAEELKKVKFKSLFIDLSTCRDFQDLQLKTVEVVYETFGKTAKKSLLQKLHQVIGSLGISMTFDPMTGLPGFSLSANSNREETPSLKILFQFLSDLKENTLIVFDEFQQINHFIQPNTEASIRSLAQQFPNLRFAFSGSHRGIMQSMFNSPNRPFYKSTQVVDLIPIELGNYQPFIQRHFKTYKKEIKSPLIKKIYQWSRGETYSIQLLCNRLFAKTEQPTEDDFIKVCKEVLKEQSHLYSEWLNLLPYNQVKLLKAIAREEAVKSPTAKSFIQQYGLGATSSVQTALSGLIDKEIIFKDQGSHYIHDVLLGKWLRKQ
jgi:AAA+ ATPase superfamily predicted ATPase